MEKRVFLAIFLCFIVLAVYQAMFPPPAPPPPRDVQGQEQAGPVAAVPAAPGTAPAEVAAPAAEPAPADVPVIGDTAAREIVVETDTVIAVFSNVGATLQSLKLKRYADRGALLDLVPADVPATAPRPFALSTGDPALSRKLATALFRPSAVNLSLGAAPGTLSFDYSDQSGLNARKTFHLQPEGKAYVVTLEAAVDVAGASQPVTVDSGLALGLGYDPENSSSMPVRVVQFRDGDVERLTPEPGVPSHFEGELKFAGVENQYFLSAVLPDTQRISLDYVPVSFPVPGDAEQRTRAFISYKVSVPGALSIRYFLGPKDFDILRNVDARLELVRAIDFGFFAPLVVPLLQALKWINGYLGNFGWSIVALTVLINLAIFPLRHKSMVSMRKMQALQPEVKSIQDRYAKYKLTDPERQKMNQEMMALYKQKGVNPVSGCLPMLMTMPVLFAFYSMLSVAIELRGAPFVGWITDLANRDPLYITPVLMGLSMLWQQRMMPTTADPIQQKIFLMMPVIFTFSFLWAPSGLVVYWFVSNMLAIGQQYLTNRMIGAPVPRPVASRKKANV